MGLTSRKIMPGRPRLILAASVLLLACLFIPSGWSQVNDMANMPSMSGMDHDNPSELATRAPDTHTSEFNHRLVGFILVLGSAFVLADEFSEKRCAPVRYVWPLCLLMAGIFVLICSDAEIWPFGPLNPWYALTHSLEDLQHKGFAVILLGLGYVELRRAGGKFGGVLPALLFPVLATLGALLLLFHVHSGDMSGPDAMKVMVHIETQHRWFAATGLGIAVVKAMADIPYRRHQALNRVWPALLAVLGFLLMAYTENIH
jgi:hypothetical protein